MQPEQLTRRCQIIQDRLQQFTKKVTYVDVASGSVNCHVVEERVVTEDLVHVCTWHSAPSKQLYKSAQQTLHKHLHTTHPATRQQQRLRHRQICTNTISVPVM